jgi:hypothetical protein
MHPAVPISGLVKSAGLDRPTTMDLIGFGETGATSRRKPACGSGAEGPNGHNQRTWKEAKWQAGSFDPGMEVAERRQLLRASERPLRATGSVCTQLLIVKLKIKNYEKNSSFCSYADLCGWFYGSTVKGCSEV